MNDGRSRRAFLAALTAGLAGVAGCSGGGDDAPGTTVRGGTATPTATATDTTTVATPTSTPTGTATQTTTDRGRVRNPSPAPGDYHQFQYDPANTGRSPGTAPEARPTERWRLAKVVTSRPLTVGRPAVADGTVYVQRVADDDGEPVVGYAVDAASGSVEWSRTVTDLPPGAGPAVVAGDLVLFVGFSLYAHDRATGERRFEFGDSGFVERLTVTDGYAYVVVSDGSTAQLTRLDLATATADWTVSGPPGWEGHRPGVVEDTVLLGGDDLVALDAATGDRRWTAGLDHTVTVAPTVSGGRVYAAGGGGAVSAVTIGGTPEWTVTIPAGPGGGDGAVGSSPAVTDAGLYAVRDGRVTALDADGERRWTTSAGLNGPPVATDRAVLTTRVNELTALAAGTGDERWRYRTDTRFSAPVAPAVLDGTVLFHDGNLRALSA